MTASELTRKFYELEQKLRRLIVTRCDEMPTTNVGKLVIFESELYFWNGAQYEVLISVGSDYVTQQELIDALGGVGLPTVVANYSALPDPTTVAGQFYFVENHQGTEWLWGSLGGTYYPAGEYYSNGIVWRYEKSAYQATQVTVDAGINDNQFLTSFTFENAAKWGEYVVVNGNQLINDLKTFTNNLTVNGNLSVLGNTGLSLTGASGVGIKYYTVGVNFLSPGQITLNTANNIIIGGNAATALIPSFKRSGTNIQVKLANDSDFTFIEDLYRRSGSGTPEGVVTAPVGAIYHRSDGGTNTSLYVKESGGATSSGWVAK